MLFSSAFFVTAGLAYNYDYQLIENWADSKTSCSQAYRNEWACKGYGNSDPNPCDWETCKQHCDNSEYCLFFFTNQNDGCHLYSNCDSTRSTQHVGNTWARIVGGSALHTAVMDLTPQALNALQSKDEENSTLTADAGERPDRVGMWVVIAVMIVGVLTIAGLFVWKKCGPEPWTPFEPKADIFEAYGSQQPGVKHRRLEEDLESYQNQSEPSVSVLVDPKGAVKGAKVEMGRTSEVYF